MNKSEMFYGMVILRAVKTTGSVYHMSGAREVTNMATLRSRNPELTIEKVQCKNLRDKYVSPKI